ncbi:unnamed protein product, partial [Meganyctiphanes norvegica]
RYPPESDAFRKIFKSCATFPLMLPAQLQHVDSAVYIDTDTIFLHPPEDIWKEFDNFNHEESAGLSRDGFNYLAFLNEASVPSPGVTGFNSGVMLMNLTRLRSFPGGGFTYVTKHLFRKYNGKLRFGDQDILNIFFFQNPRLLYELGCEWNYARHMCYSGRNSCLEAAKHGASIVHGSGGAFRRNQTYTEVFGAWEEYELGTPIQTLVTKIQERLARHKALAPKRLCIKIDDIEYIFTKQLSLYTD